MDYHTDLASGTDIAALAADHTHHASAHEAVLAVLAPAAAVVALAVDNLAVHPDTGHSHDDHNTDEAAVVVVVVVASLAHSA